MIWLRSSGKERWEFRRIIHKILVKKIVGIKFSKFYQTFQTMVMK